MAWTGHYVSLWCRLKTLAPSVATGADTLVACHGSVRVRLPLRQGAVAARRRHNYKAKFGILVGPWEQNVWLYTHLRGDTSGTARQPRIGKDDPTAAVLPPFGTGGAGL